MRTPSTGRGHDPKVDASTLAYWHLDDSDAAEAADMIGNARPLSQVLALDLPTIGTGLLGQMRAFAGSEIIGRDAEAADMTAVQGEWTASVWVRALEVPAEADVTTIFALGGLTGSETEANNAQFSMRLTTEATVVPFPGDSGEARLELFWEHGAGDNELMKCTTVDFRRYLGRWVLLTWRKTDDGAGTFTVDCMINGRVCETFDTVPNSTSDAVITTQRWTLGGELNGSSALTRPFTGEISGVIFTAAVLTDAEVRDQWRRGSFFLHPSSVVARLLVEDQDETMRDLCDPEDTGDDYVEALTITTSIDDPTEQLTATLARESGQVSLAPFKGDSFLNNPLLIVDYSPFIQVFRRYQLEVARVPLWTDPVDADWWLRLEGRIDSFDDGGERMILAGRDGGGRLADRLIREEIKYPQTGDLNTNGCGTGAAGRETVLQAILDNNGGSGFGVFGTVYTPIPTQSCMVPNAEPLPRALLLPTLRALAGQIGWDFRSRWDPLTDQFRPTFYDPQRALVAPDLVINDDDVLDMRSGKVEITNVRNRILVTFPDASIVDAEGFRSPNFALVEDTASVADFDARDMEIIEDQSSQIDTSVEAERMATALLDDLKDPKRNTSHTLVGMPEIELGDLATFDPDEVRTTLVQDGAVRALTHVFDPGGSHTDLQAEGKPAGGFKRWLAMEATRVGRAPIRTPAEAITGRGVGFLLPAIADIVDRTLYLGGQKFMEVKNSDFRSWTRSTTYPPDSWTMAVGTWGTGITITHSITQTGAFALLFTSETPEIQSDFVPIDGTPLDDDNPPGTPYTAEMTWLRTGGEDFVQMSLDWYDADRTFLDSTDIQPKIGASDFPPVTGDNVWFTSKQVNLYPSATGDARFVRLRIKAVQKAGSFTDTIVIDKVEFYRTGRAIRAVYWPDGGGSTNCVVVLGEWMNQVLQIMSGTAVPFRHGFALPPAAPEPCDGTAVAGFGSFVTVPETGVYTITGRLTFFAVGVEAIAMRLVKNATYDTDGTNLTGDVLAVGDTGETAAAAADVGVPDGSGENAIVVTVSVIVLLVEGDRVAMEWFSGTANSGDVVYEASPEFTTLELRQHLAD